MQPSSRKFPWLVWLATGTAVILAGFALDDRAQTAFDAAQSPALKNLAWWLSKSAEGEIIGGIGILFAVIFFLLRQPRIAGKIVFIF